MATKKAKREERRKVSARKKAEASRGGERTALEVPEGLGFWKPKSEGTYKLDVIPYKVGKGNPNADEGELHYERTYFVHGNIGANTKLKYPCPLENESLSCPVCERVNELKKDYDKNKNEINSIKAKERQLYLIIDHADRDKGLQLFDISYHLFGKWLEKKVKNSEEGKYDYFADIEEGQSIKAVAEQKSNSGYSFLEFNDIEFFERKKSLEESLVDEAPCLDEIVKTIEYKELDKIFYQLTDDVEKDEDEDETDEEENPKKSSKKGKDKDEEEDEEDEEGEDEGEEDSEEDAAESEESDDEDEVDDEEEDEATAESLGIEAGDEVKYKGKDMTVVKVSGDGTSLTLKDAKGKVTPAVAPKDVELVEVEEPEEDDDDDDEDEDEKPAKKSGKKVKDEEEEEEEESEEDEPEEDDEWEDDDSSEEEEEEPAPKKKSKK